MKKLLTIVGARPQFIKLAPMAQAINEHNASSLDKKIQHIIVHTGQHYDYKMSKVFFDQLKIPDPDYNLEVGSASHGKQTGQMLEKIEEVILKEKPDMTVVYGDTNSTLSGALASAKLHIPVSHIEAGLRSYNKKMPEEINRVLSDYVSTLLFCPTQKAVENLLKESIKENIYNVGDVMYDAALFALKESENMKIELEKFGVHHKEYILVTIHRAENTDDLDRLEQIFESLIQLSEKNLKILVPLHPRTVKKLNLLPEDIRNKLDKINIIEPLSYFEMLRAEKSAKVILTDSGGIQKEAYFFKVPCITMRDETEWTELIECKVNFLVKADTEKIVDTVSDVLSNSQFNFDQNLYGDGKASLKIIERISQYLF
ncbi:MAG TPA: UDP-N-acetylglucosamine 2-epimerase (non-hydrolyzing) [Exilispira sp.]|nr:UDP-N-acetylglucosamine 2-epimerase (non-hydrolyzing) [Exilispira sp.]